MALRSRHSGLAAGMAADSGALSPERICGLLLTVLKLPAACGANGTSRTCGQKISGMFRPVGASKSLGDRDQLAELLHSGFPMFSVFGFPGEAREDCRVLEHKD